MLCILNVMLKTKEEIKIWLKNGSYLDYHIDDNLVVHIHDDVRLANQSLNELPFQFGHITGNFNCCDNQLTSLEGSPISVSGVFDCSHNQLTSLKGAPSIVDSFYCDYNQLTSLKFLPKKLRNLGCSHNLLTSLKDTTLILENLNASHNLLTSFENFPILVGQNNPKIEIDSNPFNEFHLSDLSSLNIAENNILYVDKDFPAPIPLEEAVENTIFLSDNIYSTYGISWEHFKRIIRLYSLSQYLEKELTISDITHLKVKL